jgi:hypothetical protein
MQGKDIILAVDYHAGDFRGGISGDRSSGEFRWGVPRGHPWDFRGQDFRGQDTYFRPLDFRGQDTYFRPLENRGKGDILLFQRPLGVSLFGPPPAFPPNARSSSAHSAFSPCKKGALWAALKPPGYSGE